MLIKASDAHKHIGATLEIPHNHRPGQHYYPQIREVVHEYPGWVTINCQPPVRWVAKCDDTLTLTPQPKLF